MPSLSSNSYAIGTRTGWQVQARCLMLNHFHLVVETPPLNVVVGMKWFRGTYTAHFRYPEGGASPSSPI